MNEFCCFPTCLMNPCSWWLSTLLAICTDCCLHFAFCLQADATAGNEHFRGVSPDLCRGLCLLVLCISNKMAAKLLFVLACAGLLCAAVASGDAEEVTHKVFRGVARNARQGLSVTDLSAGHVPMGSRARAQARSACMTSSSAHLPWSHAHLVLHAITGVL